MQRSSRRRTDGSKSVSTRGRNERYAVDWRRVRTRRLPEFMGCGINNSVKFDDVKGPRRTRTGPRAARAPILVVKDSQLVCLDSPGNVRDRGPRPICERAHERKRGGRMLAECKTECADQGSASDKADSVEEDSTPRGTDPGARPKRPTPRPQKDSRASSPPKTTCLLHIH